MKKTVLGMALTCAAFSASALDAQYNINFPEGAERVFQLPVGNYSLSGANAAAFEIEDNEFLAFKTAPDYESGDRTFTVTVNSNGESSQFNITVDDVSTGAFENLGMKPLNSNGYSVVKNKKTNRWVYTRTFPVQDREYVKLDVNGIPLTDQSATNHRCVVDGANGLWWEVKDAPQAATPKADKTAGESAQDVYDRFTYFNSATGEGVENASNNQNCHGYTAGVPSTYCNSSAYAQRINEIALCGKTDWRAPTGEDLGVKQNVYMPNLSGYASNNGVLAEGWDDETFVKHSELRTLLTPPSQARRKTDTYVDENYFPNTRPSHFLAASTYVGSMPDLACQSPTAQYNWTTFFTHGYGSAVLRRYEVSSPCKAESRHHLRLVRSNYTPVGQ